MSPFDPNDDEPTDGAQDVFSNEQFNQMMTDIVNRLEHSLQEGIDDVRMEITVGFISQDDQIQIASEEIPGLPGDPVGRQMALMEMGRDFLNSQQGLPLCTFFTLPIMIAKAGEEMVDGEMHRYHEDFEPAFLIAGSTIDGRTNATVIIVNQTADGTLTAKKRLEFPFDPASQHHIDLGFNDSFMEGVARGLLGQALSGAAISASEGGLSVSDIFTNERLFGENEENPRKSDGELIGAGLSYNMSKRCN